MTYTAEEYRAMANDRRAASQRSFDRCDTDGFVSQACHDLNAQLYDRLAVIVENGNKGRFLGLYHGDRRIAAKMITTRFGTSWLLREDEAEKFGRKFVPMNYNGRSRVHKALGISERYEYAPAWATIGGSGKGFSGLATAHVVTFRTGDKWGLDSEVEKED